MELFYLGMTSTSTVLAIALAIIGLLYMIQGLVLDPVKTKQGTANFPPGPKGWPIVGNLVNIPMKGWVVKQAKIYGEIFTLTMGSLRVIHLSGKALKEALTDGHVLSERAPVPAMYDYYRNRGLFGASFHDTWRQQRSFTFKILNRTCFNGRQTIEERVLQETESIISEIRKKDGQPMDVNKLLKLAACNMICSFVSGQRYDYDNSAINDLIQTMSDCMQQMEYGCVSIFFPVLKYIPGFGLKGFFEKIDQLRFQQMADIARHKAKLDRSRPADFIDYYLMEIERCQKEGVVQGEAGFTEDNLQYALVDLFMAGLETTATTLHWVFLMVLLHPDILAKVQEELDRVGDPEDGFIRMEDQQHCPYTQAVILETQRFGTIAPSTMRALTKDSKIGRYQLPKDTMVLLNFLDTHYDDQLWDDPQTFNPSRFISKESPETIVRHDSFMPYSAGRRSCPGERMAKIELFIFFANIAHRFHISLPPNTPTPSAEATGGLTRTPQPYQVCFSPRTRKASTYSTCSTQRLSPRNSEP